VLLPIPNGIEEKPVVIGACTAVVVGMLLLAAMAYARGDNLRRTLILFFGIYGLSLCAFYGLYFGAGHFVNRYLFPLSPILALLWAEVGLWLWLRVRSTPPAKPVLIVPLLLVLIVTGLNARLYKQGNIHMHFQVVEWVNDNVPEDTWVGAIQTGTLGYFHDRTINLDGKVNPEALEAKLNDEIPKYVVEKRIPYLADWAGIVDWMQRPEIGSTFEIVVEDKKRNLAVLKRVDRGPDVLEVTANHQGDPS
jgi:hypothetical protein